MDDRAVPQADQTAAGNRHVPGSDLAWLSSPSGEGDAGPGVHRRATT